MRSAWARYGRRAVSHNGNCFFASALLGSALLIALIFFLTPRAERFSNLNRHSVLERAVAAYAQYGRRATWQSGAIVILWQSRRAAWWGDEWLLWRSGTDWGERDLSGGDWSAWVWGWPLFDALTRILWSSVTLALLAGFALHALQIAFVSLRRWDEIVLLKARRWLWFLGAFWFACLGARYFWLRSQAAIAWRGNDATVPVGWDWLSWHLTRLTDSGGIILAACGWLLCALAIIGPASTCSRFSRPAWIAAVLAWWLPGTLQVLAGGPLWHLVVAPDETAREAPFKAAYLNATQRAWQVDTQTQPVRAVPVENLTSTERANLANTARVWDEEALQAALGEADARVPPTLNRENGRLVGVTPNGVYDATRAPGWQAAAVARLHTFSNLARSDDGRNARRHRFVGRGARFLGVASARRGRAVAQIRDAAQRLERTRPRTFARRAHR